MDVETVEDLRDVRMAGSTVDYDGDGDVDEGIYYEIVGLQETLYQSLQTYAADVAGAPIAYDSHNYPYFVGDLNGNGEVDEDEVGGGNAYAAWTRAAASGVQLPGIGQGPRPVRMAASTSFSSCMIRLPT